MNRRDYLIRKLGFSLITVLIVLVINFVLFRILPGDPVRAVIGRNVRISPEVQQALRVQFGLDKPVFPDQFLDTLGQWAHGNLGRHPPRCPNSQLQPAQHQVVHQAAQTP